MFSRRHKSPATSHIKLTSLIGQGVELTGDIAFVDGLRIDGRVVGQVVGRQVEGASTATLVLSATGHIAGAVRCSRAVIDGTIEGDLDVEDFVELQSNAHVSGTIRYRQLRMDVGATVHGHMVRIEETEPAGTVLELAPGRALATA
ncbi:MAG: polymer-forming cytoskeletal protein [Rubrivivax sp.]|nr:polymer-forming cytoskeletal protein [Rubrivivax sp.]